jgi:hypothetical protein
MVKSGIAMSVSFPFCRLSLRGARPYDGTGSAQWAGKAPRVWICRRDHPVGGGGMAQTRLDGKPNPRVVK